MSKLTDNSFELINLGCSIRRIERCHPHKVSGHLRPCTTTSASSLTRWRSTPRLFGGRRPACHTSANRGGEKSFGAAIAVVMKAVNRLPDGAIRSTARHRARTTRCSDLIKWLYRPLIGDHHASAFGASRPGERQAVCGPLQTLGRSASRQPCGVGCQVAECGRTKGWEVRPDAA